MTRDFFRGLAVPPLLGRAPGPDDFKPGAPGVAVLVYDTWRSRFNGDPKVVGQTLTLNHQLMTVVAVMRAARYKYILNGVLFGATVGAGFAAFETAGYALNEGFLPGLLQGLVSGQTQTVATHQGVVAMLQILRLRGIMAPLGHIAWTAISAGAFWRVKKDRPVSPAMLLDVHFLKAMAIPVTLHALWDAPDFMQLPFYGNIIITGLISWYVVFGLVQQGLRQVKDEQRAHLQTSLARVEASMQPAAAGAVSY